MSMLDRYKKSSAAMMELVKLIEDSPEPKRGNLLKMIRAEDVDFANRVEKRVIDWPKFRSLDEGIMAEAMSSSAAKTIAMALYGEDEDFARRLERILGSKFSDYKQEKDSYKKTPPTPTQVDTSRKKMISEARKLESEGAFKLLNYDQIDGEQPDGGGAKINVESSGQMSGTAKEDDGVPDVTSFVMEPPPAGLLGERLETYLKKELGVD